MGAEEFNIFQFLKTFMVNGGFFMWIILFVWVTGLGISIYKFIKLKAYDINAVKFYDKVKGFVLNNDIEQALLICANSRAILPRILRSGLKRANEDRLLIEDAMTTTMLENTPKISYQLSYISLIANVSTLIGLLGTIQGLIISFAGVATAEPGMKAKILSLGIAKAMNTTAFGLISAITIMVFHTFLVNKAQRLNDSIDEVASKLVDLLSVKKKQGTDA